MTIAATNPWKWAVDIIHEILKEAQETTPPLLDTDIELLKWDPDPKTADYITVVPGALERVGQPHGLDVVVKVGGQLTGTSDAEDPLLKITNRLTQIIALVDLKARDKRIRILGVAAAPRPEQEDPQAELYWVGYVTFTLQVASGR